MFSIILIIPIILILPDVCEHFEDKPDAKRALLDNFFFISDVMFRPVYRIIYARQQRDAPAQQ
jgi:hypothetical protein